MLLEVTWELDGKPLAPKMHPGQKKDIKLDFLPPCLGTIFGTFSRTIWKITICFFLVFWGRQFECYFIDVCLILGVFFGDSLGFWVNLGNSDFAIPSLWDRRFQGPLGSMFCIFWDTFLGLLPGAFFLSFSVFFGATLGLLLVPKLGLGVVFDATKKSCKNRFGGNPRESPRILRNGGGGPIITSGLWPSWVILPLGPWSLPRGRGVRLGTGHALRSKRGGGLFSSCRYLIWLSSCRY